MQTISIDNHSVNHSIRTTMEYALMRCPAMTNLMQAFAGLFLEKDRCMAHLQDLALPVDLNDCRDRLMSGIPVLTTLSLAPWHNHLKMAFEWMLPSVKQAFPAIGTDVDAIVSAQRDGRLELVLLAQEYLDGGFNHYVPTAQSIGVSADTLGFVIRTVLSAVLGSVASTLGADMKNMAWSKGTCPVCGALPSVSFLARPVDDPGEFLKDTGGQKFLHCGLCGHDWRFNRHTCPVCDNMDKDLQIYLMEPDQPGERVDICHKCGLYLPCVDMREREIMPHLDTAAVGMVHLDILAQQKGFQPMSDLPWNRIGV